jgi:glycyl-tRNA synthetase beta chain
MPSLLLEIGCEELPAGACQEAEAQLPALCEQHLGLSPDRLFIGPRRLAVLVDDAPERGADEWIKGPPVALREKAAEGFARRHGVKPDDLTEREGFLGVEIPGRPLREVLPERLDAIVRGLVFSKTMRWDDSGIRFPRPVRWTLAKLDGETIVGSQSFGHRFTHGVVEVPHAAAYADTMRGVDVEPDAEERRARIVEGLDRIGRWSDPAGKLAEVVHLVEWPTVLEAQFDKRYLELPERVIVTAMQSHQRYFPLGGNRFALVINGGDPDVARSGHKRVLENRLEDAKFTFDRDVRRGIDELAGELSAITFFAEAGSFADKTERLVKLAKRLGGGEASQEAARLAKADQAAELVREFPELEGHIGSEYARLAGYPEAVCAAIDEQYLPDAAGGPLPQTEAGKVLAAAEKIDNLTVAFELGHKPTGSRDPFGLRRAAIGLCRLADEGDLAISRDLLPEEVRDFVEERLEGLLDVPVEFVRAARASSVTDLGSVAWLARQLAALPDEQLDPVHTVYTRAARIAGDADGDVDPALLHEDAELALAKALQSIDLSTVSERDAKAFAAAATLAPVVERFFDEVLVMAEDSAIKANRLALLGQVRDEVGRLGDFSQIPR